MEKQVLFQQQERILVSSIHVCSSLKSYLTDTTEKIKTYLNNLYIHQHFSTVNWKIFIDYTIFFCLAAQVSKQRDVE